MNIKVNELRIGNSVKCKTSNDAGIYRVEAIDGIHLKVYLSSPRNVWHSEDKLKPIQITEEWLLKYGFTRHHNDYFNDVIGIKNVIDFNSGDPNKKFDYFIYPKNNGSAIYPKTNKELRFVHQLQNLYFSLTGHELEAVANGT